MPAKQRLALLMQNDEYYTRTIAAGVWQYIRDHSGWGCETLVPPRGSGDWDWLMEGKCDGIITYTYNRKLIAFLEKCGIPSVNVSNALPPKKVRIPRVVSDDFAVGKMAAEHFLEVGLRHFAYCGTTAHVSRERRRGFEETLKNVGFGCARLRSYYHIEKGRWTRTEIPSLIKQLEDGKSPLGVFCINDIYARFVIGCCSRHGIAVPEKVAVVGVNNSEVAEGLAEIPFSSVELQLEKIGYVAAENISAFINEGRPLESMFIPPRKLVVRASSDLMDVINDEAVIRSLQFIRENAFQPLQMEDMVKKVGVSRRMLEKRFRASVGRSPYAEVIRLRLEKAKRLLGDTNLRVFEVAKASGFPAMNHFHATFVQQVGLTPSLFRRNCQKVQ